MPEGNLGVLRNRLVGGSSPPAGADPEHSVLECLGPIDTMLEPMFYRPQCRCARFAGVSFRLNCESTVGDATSAVGNTVWTAARISRSKDPASQSRAQRRRSSASPAAVRSRRRWLSTARCGHFIGEASASSARLSVSTTLRRRRSVSDPRRRPRAPGAIDAASSSGGRCGRGAGNESSISSPRTADAVSIVDTPHALRLCSSIIGIHRRRSLASESSAEVWLA